MKEALRGIADKLSVNNQVDPEFLAKNEIFSGLRKPDGSGVVAGVTTKGSVLGYEMVPDAETGVLKKTPVDGKLLYCGYDVGEMARKLGEDERYGFERVVYLLLSGELPNQKELDHFAGVLSELRALSPQERSIVMKETENANQMYALHSLVSHLSRCNPDPDSIEIEQVLEQCVDLIAKLPTIIAYNYNMMRFSSDVGTMRLVRPEVGESSAESFLRMVKGEKPSREEAKLFDIALMLHAEHGGGNNSTFTVRTVSSSAANTYMAICSGIASLSGHLHGGANEAVELMMNTIKREIKDWSNEAEIREFLLKIFNKQAHDRSGKIYGMGHAVYTVSDPRALILRELVEPLAKEKGMYEELCLMDSVAKQGVELFREIKGTHLCVNVDFYSGFLYRMLGIPMELYTPIFAMSRISGWSAHRIEQLMQNKIVRPAYLVTWKQAREYQRPF